MLQSKYLFLPFVWSLLYPVGPYEAMNSSIPPIAYSLREQYRISMSPHKYPIFSPSRGQTKGPFPSRYPSELSFTAMQRTAQEEVGEPVGPIKTRIQYEAQDSIVFDIQQKIVHLYGVGDIGHEDKKLEAENIALDWSTNSITAAGKQNEVGEVEKKIVFTQGDMQYIADEIRYNFDSKRGTARKLLTKQEEAIIQCDKAKVDTEDTYYTDRIKYTTCNLVKPHYYIKASKVKFIQDKQVASGPFQVYFDDVPTPLGFFYGLFFIPRPKISGILPPKLGEDPRRGFFLKGGGYYFYFNDYIDLALRGTLYSKGSSSFSAQSNYKKRYGYAGELSYAREINTTPDEQALQQDKDKRWRFQWKHNTEHSRVSSLAADVDIQSQSSKKNNTQLGDETLNATTNSQIQYTNSLVGLPYMLRTSLAHSKNLQTKVTDLTLPQISLSTSPIYPFRRKVGSTKRWYTDIYFKHSFEFKNHLSNVINRDTLEISRQNLPRLFKEGRYGAKHELPLETNIKICRYFNLKPSLQYQERWYFKRLDYQYDAVQDTIIADTTTGFKRVWNYSLGASLQTTLYGTHFFSPDAAIQAIRHQLEPAVGFTYTPDFSKERYGYWQKVKTKQGEKLMSRFDNFVYGTPKNRASAIMDIKVGNTLEMKVRNTADPARRAKKVPILEAFNLSTSYDFLADSFKLSDIKLEARTRVLDSLVSIEYETIFDPYIYEQQKKVEKFAWHYGQGLGHIKRSSLKVSTSLKPPGDSSKPGADELSSAKQPHEPLPIDSTQYVDFNIPWSLNLTYHRNYTYQIELDKKEVSKQLSFDGDVSLTEKWKISFGSTYDIDQKELIGHVTKLGIYRDLHCWQMNFDWRPLGQSQSYEFSIGLKAPMLQDIKYDRSNEYEKF